MNDVRKHDLIEITEERHVMNKKGNLKDYLNDNSELYEKERNAIEEEFSNLRYKKLLINHRISGSFKGKKHFWKFNLQSHPLKKGSNEGVQKHHVYELICDKFYKKYSFSQRIKNIELAAKEAGYDSHATGVIFPDFIISDIIFKKIKEQHALFIEDAEKKRKDGTIDKKKNEDRIKRQKNGAIVKLKNKISEAYSKGVELEEIINLAKELNIKYLHEQ